MDEKTRYQVAIHESGHAFIYIHLGHTFKYVDISLVDNPRRFGGISGGKPIISQNDLDNFIHIRLSQPEDNRIGNIIANLITIYLAGYESERIFEVYNPENDTELNSLDYSRAYSLADAVSTRNSSSDAHVVLDDSRELLTCIVIENKSIIEKFASELLKYNEVRFELLKEIYTSNFRCN